MKPVFQRPLKGRLVGTLILYQTALPTAEELLCSLLSLVAGDMFDVFSIAGFYKPVFKISLASIVMKDCGNVSAPFYYVMYLNGDNREWHDLQMQQFAKLCIIQWLLLFLFFGFDFARLTKWWWSGLRLTDTYPMTRCFLL